jgi:hypothetical protein
MRNDPRAIKLLLSLIERYAASPETTLQLDTILAEDQVILERYLQKAARPDGAPTLLAKEGQSDEA